MDHVGKLMGEQINLVEEEYAALENADALMIMTEWPVFRTPDLNLMKSKMREPVIFDGRNLYDPVIMKENGFNYISIGRKEIYVKK
jgi:UDPglucose 6-dehydrogenase